MVTHKHSKKRDAILECVRSTKLHPTAEWVYAQLKPQIPDLSLGTVYRNLAAFKKEGIIAPIGVIGGNEHFDGNTAPHAHFICTRCEAIIDTENLDYPIDFTQKVTCGKVHSYSLIFIGICNQCATCDASQ